MVQLISPVARKLIENKDEALVDGGLAQPAPFRIWCGRVLGAVALRLDSKRIEELFLKKALNLCQDTDYEVRRSMCNQLNIISKAVGLKLTKSELIPEYLELIMDEESIVRQAAITNLMNLLDFLDAETRSSIVIPLWKRLCEERAPSLIGLIAQHMGVFLWTTRAEMTEADKKYFFGVYQSIASMKNAMDETRREMCAYNFPNFESLKLDKTLDALMSDESLEVRLRMAYGFHEVVIQLHNAAFKLTKDRLVRTLASDVIQIVQAILPNIEVILKTFLLDDAAKAPNQLDDIFMTLVQRERDISSASSLAWRTHLDILSAFRLFPDYFDSDAVFEQCVPPLFKILSEQSALPIKSLVIKTLVGYLRKLKRVEHRELILKQLIETKEDRSYHQRIMFLDICEAILAQFSRKFFRDHIFHHYLGLSRDPVANIRLRFVSMIPMVRRTIRLPMDAALLQKLLDVIDPLLARDSDGDVMSAMSRVLAKFGSLEGDGFSDKAISLIASSMGKSVGTDPFNMFGTEDTGGMANEAADRIKEEEESKLLFEQMGTDWSAKRRELHEARQEFHRRFGEKEVGAGSGSGSGSSGGSSGATKRGNLSFSAKVKGGATGAGSGGNSSEAGGSSGGSGGSGSGGSGVGRSSTTGGNRKRVSSNAASTSTAAGIRSAAGSGAASSASSSSSIASASSGSATAGSGSSGSIVSGASLTHEPISASPVAALQRSAATQSVVSPTSSKTSLAGQSKSGAQSLAAPSSGSSDARRPRAVSRSTGSSVQSSFATTSSSSSSAAASGTVSNSTLLGRHDAPNNTDELRNLEHEVSTAASSAPLNLSKAGTSTAVGVSLPKVTSRMTSQNAMRPSSRSTNAPPDRILELPSAV
eukprot:jgi/Hompol1/2709/HPOL_003014-RA